MDVVINAILTNPLAQGFILGQVKAFLEGLAKKVDDEKLAEKNKNWLQPVLVVLTLTVTAISLALEGKLHELNFDQLQMYLVAAINIYTGAIASQAAGSKTITKLADKVKGK